MGHGTIIAGSTLTMAATQKTFSIAVSRQMAPVARLVAYFIHDGEVVADALSFHVSYSRLKTVKYRCMILRSSKTCHKEHGLEISVTSLRGSPSYLQNLLVFVNYSFIILIVLPSISNHESEHYQTTLVQEGYATWVNNEISVSRETAVPLGPYITLKPSNALKDALS